MGRPKQQTIADSLGISRTTVSRCFSNHPGINPETRARVFKAASELGYRPHLPRAGTARRDAIQARVAVIVGRRPIEEISFPEAEAKAEIEVLGGLSEGALLNSWILETHTIDQSIHDPSTRLNSILRAEDGVPWDGLFFLHSFPAEFLIPVVNRFPCVSIKEAYGVRVQIDSVTADSNRGFGRLVDRLVLAGHSRIGFFSGFSPSSSVSQSVLRRFGATTQSLARHGLTMDSSAIFNLFPHNRGEDNDVIPRVIDQIKDGVTAIVCASDLHAYHLMDYLQKEGIKVPKDVSITGYEGLPAVPGRKQLASASIPNHELGVTAIQRMETLLRRRNPITRHILLDTIPQVGETLENPRETAASDAPRLDGSAEV